MAKLGLEMRMTCRYLNWCEAVLGDGFDLFQTLLYQPVIDQASHHTFQTTSVSQSFRQRFPKQRFAQAGYHLARSAM